ncbi:hypothetical protein AAE478_001339 [Parahypoxylon ruwenzoriense]
MSDAISTFKELENEHRVVFKMGEGDLEEHIDHLKETLKDFRESIASVKGIEEYEAIEGRIDKLEEYLQDAKEQLNGLREKAKRDKYGDVMMDRIKDDKEE